MNNYELPGDIGELIREAKCKKQEIDSEKKYPNAAVENAIKKLESLPALYKQKEYKLVFMGKPGSGKTSCIVNLCGLLTEELEVKLNQSPSKCLSTKNTSLLPVGSGGTTMAEEIIIDQISEEATHFLVECCSKNELKTAVKEYVEMMYLKCLNEWMEDSLNECEKEPVAGKNISIPRELVRYLENMCDKCLQEAVGNSKIAIWKCFSDDFYKKICNKVQNKDKNQKYGLENFVSDVIVYKNEASEIFSKGEIDDEVVDEITNDIFDNFIPLRPEILEDEPIQIRLDNSGNENVRTYIRKTMLKLNNGTVPGLTMVRRISVLINKNDLDMRLSANDYRITGLVDTRGYRDFEKLRDDYGNYLGDTEGRYICLFVENYKDCSGGEVCVAKQILEYNMLPNYRTGLNAILVNWCTGDPSNNADNYVESEEDLFEEDDPQQNTEYEMVGIRLDQIKTYLSTRDPKPRFETENIIAYNAQTGYIKENDKVKNYEAEKAQEERNLFLDKIASMIKRNEQNIQEEIERNYNLLKVFVQYGGITLDEISDQIIGDFCDKVIYLQGRLNNDLINEGKLKNEYGRHLKGFPLRSYKALANNGGEYYSVTYGKMISVRDVSSSVYSYYTEYINFFSAKVQEEYDKIKEKCTGANAVKVLTMIQNIKDKIDEEIGKYEGNLKILYEGIVSRSEFLGEISSVWFEVGEWSGKGVNERIKNRLCEVINDQTPKGIFGSFIEQSQKLQEAVCKEVERIVMEACS